MKRWKVRLGPDRMPVEVVTTVPGRVNQRYRLPQQFAPGFVYVSGDDELNAFVEAVKWTEQHPL
jgi:hypothetical protein